MDSLRGPTFLLLLQNLRRGMSANGISNDSTICRENLYQLLLRWFPIASAETVSRDHLTDEKMINLPAPDGPLTMETMRLGAMAMTRVIRFRTQFFIFMSRNPWKEIIKWGYWIMLENGQCWLGQTIFMNSMTLGWVFSVVLITCMITCPANVQLIVVLCPEASSATAYTTELDLPKTFWKEAKSVSSSIFSVVLDERCLYYRTTCYKYFWKWSLLRC